MITSLWRLLFIAWWVSVLLVISLPWSKFDGTPHWESIQWIPFSYLSFHRTVLTEVAANVLAFIPVGYLLVRSFTPNTRHALLLAAVVGLLSSSGIEFYQLFCQDRVPSTTDLLTNTGGTVLGAWAALRIEKLMSSSFIRLRRLS